MIIESHKLFTTYIRTKQFWQNRLRNSDAMKPVYISSNEIQERFFIKPNEIQLLIDGGLIEVIQKISSNGNKVNYYKALQAGAIKPSLLKPKGKELDTLTIAMRNNLKLVSLFQNAPSTLYFDTFLLLKKTNIELFFTIDEFSGRVHTPVSSFHRTHRPNILINGQKIESLDVVTMQPLLLGKILKNQIGENDYTTWINSGEDIYLIIKSKANLKTRDDAKKRFFEILFSKPNKQLSDMFGNSNWIEWINEFKGRPCEHNPHTLEKNHSNLAWLLQKTEVNIMRKVWQAYVNNNILFLSVHDEVIFQSKDLEKAKNLFTQILDKEFDYYKLSSKVAPALVDPLMSAIEVQPIEIVDTKLIEDWSSEITDLETFFETVNLPTQPIKLNSFTTITNAPAFIEGHLATIKANNGNKTHLPYLERLRLLKKILTDKKQTP